MNEHSIDPVANTDASRLKFDQTVCLMIDGGWTYIETGEEALACLEDLFPDQGAPSYLRAHAACSAFVEAKGSMEGARATLIVAAMEAGFPFEVGDSLELLERLAVEAAHEGLQAIILGGELEPAALDPFED